MHLLIVDDHPLFRDALASAVGLAYPDATLHEADGIASACAVLGAQPAIEIILLDLSMQGVTGFEGLMAIRAQAPRVPILVVSGLEDPRIIREALDHGAAGFVPKAVDKATLTRAIADVLAGGLSIPTALDVKALANTASRSPTAPAARKAPLAERVASLTPQQLRVLAMIRQGKLNKQIAHELQVGDSTVKAHVSEILRKLDVISRTQIVIETALLDFDRITAGPEA
ncbi:response regulator [Methylobacterium sp. J-068]|uniref:response regulator n=1 Tax=Methylobacterium sp. J-068 TaxID=2836649 RepID=UPI001FB8BEA8|nr:response regulator transcription factor [Methylobacterium sp. J-068]MCJ2037017.1 response regulator transcription factor [Methylobacterium sp. J-068]